MYKSISWKKAGVIVVLLHVGAIGGLMALNKIKSSIHRAEREKEREQLLANPNKSSMWPELKVKPQVVAYPKQVSKKIIDTASDRSLQEYIAEKTAYLLTLQGRLRKYFEGLVDLGNETAKEVVAAKKQTQEAIKKKVEVKSKPMTTVPIVRAQKPVTVPIQRPVSKPKPTPDSSNVVVQRKTIVYGDSNTSLAEREEIVQEVIRTMPMPDSTVYYSSQQATRPSRRYSSPQPDYNNIRYTYEQVVTDPYTGRVTRRTVTGPPPLGAY